MISSADAKFQSVMSACRANCPNSSTNYQASACSLHLRSIDLISFKLSSNRRPTRADPTFITEFYCQQLGNLSTSGAHQLGPGIPQPSPAHCCFLMLNFERKFYRLWK